MVSYTSKNLTNGVESDTMNLEVTTSNIKGLHPFDFLNVTLTKGEKMLHKIIDIVDKNPKLTPKKLSYYRSTLSVPLDTYSQNLPTYDELKASNVLVPGAKFVCLIQVKYLYGDDFYNRTDEFNLEKAMKNLEKHNGFCYGKANGMKAYLRPDGTLVLTQGNHRTAQRYLTLGKDAYVEVSLEVHSETDIDKIKQIESDNYNSDNIDRWNMVAEHKFKGAYGAKDPDAVALYEFVKPFGISIANTNRNDYVATHTFESYGNLIEALGLDDTPNKEYVKISLHSLKEHLTETDIKGFLFVGLVLFQKVFGERFYKIQKNNKLICSFDDFIKYVFTERRKFNGKGPLTTQQDIVEDSGGIKIREFYASRFVVLFNEYCFARDINFRVGGLKGDCAIPESCDEWRKLTESLSPVKRRLLSATQF